MRITIYVCTVILSLSILVAGLSNRYQVASMSMPEIGGEGGDEVLVRIDRLTGNICMEIGDDGYSYFEAAWTLKFNKVRENEKFYSNVLPRQCG